MIRKTENGQTYELVMWRYRCNKCNDIVYTNHRECECKNLHMLGEYYKCRMYHAPDSVTDVSEWKLVKFNRYRKRVSS